MTRRLAPLIFLLWIAGCSTIVRPPIHPAQPVVVYLTDEGMHSSVLMPVEDGRYIEYASGDWEYAALDKHDVFHAIGALFFSRQGALGRRYLRLNLAAAPMAPELQGITLHPVAVDRAKMLSVERSLATQFKAGRCPTENPENHFVFVKVDEGYGFFHNCNALTKRSLRELDCEVISRSTFAMYEIQDREQKAAASNK
jgi:hypothetical protein